MKKLLSISTAGLLSCYLPVAQGLEVYNDGTSSMDFKGNLSVYYIKSGDEAEINDGFSRYTFDLKHEMKEVSRVEKTGKHFTIHLSDGYYYLEV